MAGKKSGAREGAPNKDGARVPRTEKGQDGAARGPEKKKGREAAKTPEERVAFVKEKLEELKQKKLERTRARLERDLVLIETDLKDAAKKSEAENLLAQLRSIEEEVQELLETKPEEKKEVKEPKKVVDWPGVVAKLEADNHLGKKEVDEVKKIIEVKKEEDTIRQAILERAAYIVWEKKNRSTSERENWQAAEAILLKIEKEVPKVEAPTDETKEGEERDAEPKAPDQTVEKDPKKDAALKAKEAAEAKRPKKIVDIPLSIVFEIIGQAERGKEVYNYILDGRDEQAKAYFKTFFHRAVMSESARGELLASFERAGYTPGEFFKLWEEKLHLLVFENIKGVLNAEIKKRAADSITFTDKLKVNWKGIAKRAVVIGGLTAATGGIAGLIGGVGMAVGAGITAAGWFGRKFNKIFKRKEEEEVKEKTAILMAKKEAAEKKEIVYELFADPQNDIAGQISQAIRAGTANAGEAKNVNAAAMRTQLLWERAESFSERGEQGEADKIQLAALLAELEKSRMTAPEAIKADPKTQKKIKETTIKILEKIQGLKTGHLFSPEEKSKFKDLMSYAAPLSLGVSIGCAVEAAGLGMWGYVRAGFAGLGGGIVGYRIGEGLDKRAQRKEVEKALKNITDDVRAQLKRHDNGGAINRETLKRDINRLEGHLQIGSLDYSPKLKINAEALLREGQRVLFERKPHHENQAEAVKNLIIQLEEHRLAAEGQAKDDLARLQKKTGNWRRWVGLAGGAIAGVGLVFGLDFIRSLGNEPSPTGGRGEESPHAVSKKPEPIADKEPIVVVPAPHPSVEDTYTIQKGDGLLNAANHFQGDKAQLAEMMKGIRGGHPEWAGKSEGYVLRQWRLEQIHKEGYNFGDGWRSGTKTLHAGAEVKLVFDEKGYPSLSLGDEHVSQHGLRVEDLSPARPSVQNGTDTPDWSDNANAPRANLEPEPNISNSLNPDEYANSVANGPYGKNMGYGIADMVANKAANSPGSAIDRSNTEVKSDTLTKEYARARTEGPNQDEPAKITRADKVTREPEPATKVDRGEIDAKAEDAFTKMEDLRKFSDTKLSYDERVSFLAKTLSPGRALEVNGVKYLSLDGGRTIQYEIPLGKGALRGVVDQANLPKLTEFQDLMEQSQKATTEPAKFTAKLDKVMEELGAKKAETGELDPAGMAEAAEAGRTVTLHIGEKEVKFPAFKYEDQDSAAVTIAKIQSYLARVPDGTAKTALVDKFTVTMADPDKFYAFAEEMEEAFGK